MTMPMAKREDRYIGVDELRAQFAKRKDAIRRRLEEFAAVQPEEYFYELLYCLLTPQSSALNAAKAVASLKAAAFHIQHVDVARILASKEHYIRFHNVKAKRLHEVKRRYAEILHCMRNAKSCSDLRQWLVQNVNGLGWKEASHLLRNIGYRELAILDRHILKHLKKHGVIRSLPKSLAANRYLALETKFKKFASDVGISIDELDLLFWSEETGIILK